MKKLYLLFIVMSVLASCGNGGGSLTSKDLEANQLKGNVKSVKVSTYEAVENFGKIKKGKLILASYETIDITEFDELGNISVITNYNKNGEFEGKSIFSYKDGHKDNISSYGSDGDLILKSVFNWNNDQLISNIIYDSRGKESSKTLFEYDGNKLKTTSLYMYDNLRFKSEVVEYEGDLPKETVSYDKNGKETNRTTVEYKNGKPSIHSTYNGSYALDENGLTTKSVDCYNVLDKYSEDVKGIFIYEYEYDDKDNWIRCIVYKGEIKQPYHIVEREIMYR